MKLALAIPRLKFGGAEKQAIILSNEFVDNNISTDLLYFKSDEEIPKLISPKINLISLGKKKWWFSLKNFLFVVKDIYSYLKEYKPDVILCFDNFVGLAALFAKILSRNKVKVVVTIHSNLSSRWRHDYNRFQVSVLRSVLKAMYKYSYKVVAVSNGVRRNFMELAGISQNGNNPKVRKIYNPVITPDIFTKAENELKHPWFNPKDDSIILAVGRLDDQRKGFPVLLKAFKKVLETEKVKLIILGKGKEKSKVPKLIKKLNLGNFVDLPGYVENPYPYFKRSDIFVLSSNVEGLPGALIEALALTPAIVSTDCESGPREILEAGKWGELVSVGDDQELANSIRNVLRDTSNSSTPRKAWHRFTVKNAVQEYRDLLSFEQNYISCTGKSMQIPGKKIT